jgi:hypothetical protein
MRYRTGTEDWVTTEHPAWGEGGDTGLTYVCTCFATHAAAGLLYAGTTYLDSVASKWRSRIYGGTGGEGSWTQYGDELPGESPGFKVRALAMYGGELIVGGELGGGPYRWDGSAWVELGGGLPGGLGTRALYEYALPEDEAEETTSLLAGGRYGSPDFVYRWDGTAWTSITYNIAGGNGVYAIGEWESAE